MAKKDDFYITTLKYGRDALAKSEDVTYDKVKSHVKEIHPNINDAAFLRMFFSEFDALKDSGSSNLHHIQQNTPHVLNIEAYFRLLEHTELQEARASSRQALQRSTWAIVISAFLAVASMGAQIYQLNTPANVILSERQVERMLSTASAPRQVVLDQSQLESLLKSGESPKKVLLDAAQLEQLLKQISQSNNASQ